jgi:hypothetical protein
MKNRIKKFRISVLLLSVAFAPQSFAADESVSIPVTEMKYTDTSNGPVKVAPGYGLRTDGAHSNFVKLPGGFVSPPHYHTQDYYATVVTGVIANGKEGAQDIPLPPGSYYFQKGKERHITKCLSSTECVFFTSQPGSFDFVLSK